MTEPLDFDEMTPDELQSIDPDTSPPEVWAAFDAWCRDSAHRELARLDAERDARFADEIAAAHKKINRPILLPVDDVYTRRAELIRQANERLGKV